MEDDGRSPGVRRATHADLEAVVRVLVESHHDYVWERWALGEHDLAARLTPLITADVGVVGLGVGEVWTTEAGTSVAVWLPAGAWGRLSPDELEVLDRAAVAAFGERIDLVDVVDRMIGAARPTGDWHLATMGTLSTARRRGAGSAVLAPRLAELDRTGGIATLETSDPANLSFYGRFGFEVVAELADLPHGAPTTWVMRRTPQPVDRDQASRRSSNG